MLGSVDTSFALSMGGAARRHPWLFLYLLVTVGLAAYTFLSPWPDTAAFHAMLLFNLPLSLSAYVSIYIGGILIFGVEEEGFLLRILCFLFWIGIAAMQAIFVDRVLHARRQRRTGNKISAKPRSTGTP